QDQPTADSNAADHDQSLDAAENAPEETSNDSRSVTDTLIDVEPVSADLCLSPSTTETDGSNGEGQASVQDEQEDMQALQSFDESVINLEAAPIHEHAKHKPGDILFGKYRISEVLVSDSFSTIYRARDLSRNIRVLMEAIEIP